MQSESLNRLSPLPLHFPSVFSSFSSRVCECCFTSACSVCVSMSVLLLGGSSEAAHRLSMSQTRGRAKSTGTQGSTRHGRQKTRHGERRGGEEEEKGRGVSEEEKEKEKSNFSLLTNIFCIQRMRHINNTQTDGDRCSKLIRVDKMLIHA